MGSVNNPENVIGLGFKSPFYFARSIDGGETWEPLTWTEAQDPITVAKDAKEHKLLKKAGLKRFKKFVNKDKKFIKMVQQINATKTRNEPTINFELVFPKTTLMP